jgi:hypothetical protein
MSLSARIAARQRTPTATIRLGGVRWRDVLSLSVSQAFGQGVSTGEVVGRNPPVSIVEEETTIEWTWGYDGYEEAGFNGIVTRIVEQSYPNRIRLQVADWLYVANVRRADIATDPINSIAASDAIEQILTAAGVPRLAIPDLPASGSEWAGSEWVLGTLTPVSWTNTTPLTAAQQICEALGYWLFCDASGIVRAVQLERRPSSSPFRTLTWGLDFLLSGPPDRTRDASTVRNRVVVRGANTGVQGAQIRDIYQTGDADRTLDYDNFLIEYVNEAEAGAASATAISQRLLSIWSREPNVIRIGKVKADPRFRVGQTIAIVCPLIRLSSATPFFVYALDTSLDLASGDFAQSLTLDGGVGDSGYTTLPPPEASFSWQLVRETLDGTAVVEVILDGTGSRSLGDGEIVSYAWSSVTATALSTPDTATGPRAVFVYPAATTSAEITLTVTDTSSKTGSLTLTVPLAGDAAQTPRSRVLSAALGAAWAASPDGGATWNIEASGDSTLVPEVGGETLLSTRETGATGLRSSNDALASASVDLADLGGAITALAQTIDAPDRVWAAVGTALYRSLDGGTTFTLWGTLLASITAILEDPAVFNSVFVLAGADLAHSTLDTPGSEGWTTLYAGPSGATARHLVRGRSGATTWVCYTGTFTGSPLHRVEGPISVAFPVVSPEVSEIRAIALSDDELNLYAWDQEGRIWSIDGQDGTNVTQFTSAHPAGETVQHALHDPDDPIVYVASFGTTAGTLRKLFPLADQLLLFYQAAAGQQAHRIGTGSRGLVNASILVPTTGETPGGVYAYADGAWVLKNSGLPSGWSWKQIAVNPFNTADWVMVGDDGTTTRTGTLIQSSGQPIMWRTVDGGATWSGIEIADHPTFVGTLGYSFLHIPWLGWSSTGKLFFGAQINRFNVLQRGGAIVWSGDGSGTMPIIWSRQDTGAAAKEVQMASATAGSNGDIVVSLSQGSNGGRFRWGWIEDGGSTLEGDYQLSNDILPDRPYAVHSGLVGRSTVVNISGTWILVPDYRVDLIPAGLASGVYGAATGSHIATNGSNPNRIVRLTRTNPPVEQGDQATAAGPIVFASDRQTQTAMAAMAGTGANAVIWYSEDNGATWSSIARPSDTIQQTLAVLRNPIL